MLTSIPSSPAVLSQTSSPSESSSPVSTTPPSTSTSTLPSSPARSQMPGTKRPSSTLDQAKVGAKTTRPASKKRKLSQFRSENNLVQGVLGGTTRKGKWSQEEEEYVAMLITVFKAGQLPDSWSVPSGTTLRLLLADRLGCTPMRITKKFAGAASVRKQHYRMLPLTERTSASTLRAHMYAQQLTALEQRFVDRLSLLRGSTKPKSSKFGAAAKLSSTPKATTMIGSGLPSSGPVASGAAADPGATVKAIQALHAGVSELARAGALMYSLVNREPAQLRMHLGRAAVNALDGAHLSGSSSSSSSSGSSDTDTSGFDSDTSGVTIACTDADDQNQRYIVVTKPTVIPVDASGRVKLSKAMNNTVAVRRHFAGPTKNLANLSQPSRMDPDLLAQLLVAFPDLYHDRMAQCARLVTDICSSSTSAGLGVDTVAQSIKAAVAPDSATADPMKSLSQDLVRTTLLSMLKQ